MTTSKRSGIRSDSADKAGPTAASPAGGFSKRAQRFQKSLRTERDRTFYLVLLALVDGRMSEVPPLLKRATELDPEHPDVVYGQLLAGDRTVPPPDVSLPPSLQAVFAAREFALQGRWTEVARLVALARSLQAPQTLQLMDVAPNFNDERLRRHWGRIGQTFAGPQ